MNDTGDTKGQSEGRGKGSGHKRCCGVCCLRGGVRGCCLHGWPTRMAGLGGIAARCPCHGLLPTLWPAAPKLSKKGGADRADCRGQKGRQGAQVALRSRRPRTAGPPSPPPLRAAGGLAGAHTNIQSGSVSAQPIWETAANLGEAYLSRAAGRLEVLACTNSWCTACRGDTRGGEAALRSECRQGWRAPAPYNLVAAWEMEAQRAFCPAPLKTHLCAVAQVARRVAAVVGERGGPAGLVEHPQRHGDARGGDGGGQVVEHGVVHQRQLSQVAAQELKGHVQGDLACRWVGGGR